MVKLSKSEAGKLGAIKSAQFQKDRKNENIAAYDLNPKRCKNCEEHIPYDKRRNNFCSQSCGAVFNQMGSPSRKKTRFCKMCGKHRPKGCTVYCSPECNLADRHDETWSKIQRGEIAIRVTLKRAIARERGWACEECKLEEWRGEKIPLELDHVDGNASDNTPENLRLICPNCHAQTPTAKGKNKGNGRKSRGLPRN